MSHGILNPEESRKTRMRIEGTAYYGRECEKMKQYDEHLDGWKGELNEQVRAS